LQKFRGTLIKNDKVEAIEFEEISRAKAAGKMRDILGDNIEEGVLARLFELHRSDADLICRWSIDKNLIISEKYYI